MIKLTSKALSKVFGGGSGGGDGVEPPQVQKSTSYTTKQYDDAKSLKVD
ncbi:MULTISPECIES: hypothetical protein [unclassified Pseudoalteromonas]|nr:MULTISPECIES: hypothetical protein [unclassified Pseudoalteromonas]MCF2825675.1 hypothetical protein [Pseudoalteromonas sp. OF5H-5]MCF2833270.1 hypothetical protein [Pseudoalteromonas sp. DL2-H6]MCF2923765.1 hypothetical protein [Pseudoalteromonas sp. DL2-H1]